MGEKKLLSQRSDGCTGQHERRTRRTAVVGSNRVHVLSQLKFNRRVIAKSPDALSDCLHVAFEAYMTHPDSEDFDLPKRATDGIVLDAILQRLLSFSPDGRLFVDDNGTIVYGLINEHVLGDHIYVPLAKIWMLRQQDVQLFNIVCSVVKHLIYRVKIPYWNGMIHHAQAECEFAEENDEINQDETQDISSEIEFYRNGPPNEFVKFLRTFKPIPLKVCKNVSEFDNKVKPLIALTNALLRLNVTLQDLVKCQFDEDQGLLGTETIHFGWNPDSSLEMLYFSYLDQQFNIDIVPLRHICPIKDSNSWTNRIDV